MPDIKKKTIAGLKWQMINTIGANGLQFALSIILARLIMPSQFGLIAMLSIFISFSQTIINSGLSSALIRKTVRTNQDCSTAFFYNTIFALIFYSILFSIAPYIADFYEIAELNIILRVSSISLIIGALTSVHRALLIANIDFKALAIQNLIAVAISGTIGIILAIKGCEVWALVIQTLALTIISSILLIVNSKWRPQFSFSFKSLKEMLPFGSKLMMSELLNSTFNNIYYVVIGKIWQPVQLGFYNRADNFSNLSAQIPTNVIETVAYPSMCNISNDDKRLGYIYRKMIKLSAFAIFPLCLGFGALASPFICSLLTDKWSETAALLQILVIACMWYPIHSLNLTLLKVKGRSDLFLKLEIIKKTLIIISLIITIPIGIKAICIGQVVISILALIINSYYSGRLVNLSLSRQICDILPSLALSAIMAICVYSTTLLPINPIAILIIGVATGLIIYLSMAKLLKSDELAEIKSIIKTAFSK